MVEGLKLVTARDAVAEQIPGKLREIAEVAERENCVGMAVVLLRANGGSYVSTLGRGNRIAMLGAVTDLQYTIAKDGDG